VELAGQAAEVRLVRAKRKFGPRAEQWTKKWG